MIPRTKVNYGPGDLLSAAFVSETESRRREALTAGLAGLFGVAADQIILTASGRGALYVIFSCLPQRRVVLPAYTCKAVVEAALLAGKELDFVEVEEDGFNLDPGDLAGKLNPDSLLLVTHQFGLPCAAPELLARAEAAGALVIEDAAASLGSRLKGRLTGTFGRAAAFSFDSTKLLHTPLKGGFILASDRGLGARCRQFAETSLKPMPGSRKWRLLALGLALTLLADGRLYRLFHKLKFEWPGRYTDESLSSPPRLNPFYTDQLAEWQAEVLAPQLAALEDLMARRRDVYAELRTRLAGAVSFQLPPPDLDQEWAPIRFPLRIKGDKWSFYRRGVRRGLDFAFSFTFLGCPESYARSWRLAAAVLDPPFYDRLSRTELDRMVEILLALDRETAPEQGEP